MKKVVGKKLKRSLFVHQWVEDLLYFEGPILSLLKASTSQDYFYYHVDQGPDSVRWLALAVSRDEISSYLEGEISLHELTSNRDKVVLVDLDSKGEVIRVQELDIGKLPNEYMPPQEAFFDPNLSPVPVDELLPAPGQYQLTVDGEWFFEDLARLPSYYIQVYSFLYSLVNFEKQSVRSNATAIYRRYPWRGGYSSVNFFRELNGIIPSLHEPEVVAMQYASPGSITLELMNDVAERVKTALTAAMGNSEKIEQIGKGFAQVQRREKWAEVNVTSGIPRLSKENKEYLTQTYSELCRLLAICEYAGEIRQMAGNDLSAVKILLAYYRRTRKLSAYRDRSLVSF